MGKYSSECRELPVSRYSRLSLADIMEDGPASVVTILALMVLRFALK